VSEADLPHPQLAVPPSGGAKFTLTYDEGLKVGYKWYDAERKPVLFPFGFGLSYTTYSYSGMTVSQSPAGAATFSFTVKNTGNREGTEIAEVYASLPASAAEPPNRLVGWSRVPLKPGESREVSIAVSAKYLSVFDEIANDWKLIPGIYTFRVGGSSRDLPLMTSLALHSLQ
jgi:beta-glucosidase